MAMTGVDAGEFTGKTVLITGGSSGIGRAAASAFCEAGAAVFILGRDEGRLESARAELEQYGGNGRQPPRILKADVSRPDECERAVAAAADRTGALDVLVNSAGVYVQGPSREVTEAVWDEVLDTNLKGTFFMCRYAIPALETTGGCIVNVASDSGLTGNDGAAVYCASKGGVVLLTRSLAVELARAGIRVNAVCPGVVETPMVARDFEASTHKTRSAYDAENLKPYPAGTKRFVSPEEVAAAILFLASPLRAGAVNGACLPVDFGLTAGY